MRQITIIENVRTFRQEKGILPPYSLFKCSKSTVHKAFKDLEEQGIVRKEGLMRVIKDFSWFNKPLKVEE